MHLSELPGLEADWGTLGLVALRRQIVPNAGERKKSYTEYTGAKSQACHAMRAIRMTVSARSPGGTGGHVERVDEG